jgi:hypothetical protein
MRVLKVIAVATLFCAVRVGHGTSFYFVHNGDAIYIACDTFLSGPPSELNLAPKCKMVVSQRYVTVLTGSLGITKVSWSKDHKVPIGSANRQGLFFTAPQSGRSDRPTGRC